MKNEYKPKFSVITPTYNRCYCLWKAIQSVINQSYPFFEMIIIDDCSSDDTEKMVAEFSDPRIRYYKLDKNSGASAARNFGLEKAVGEYVAYLDSDNSWYPEFLEVMNKSFVRYPEKIVSFCKKNYRLTIVEDEGKEVKLRDEISFADKYFDLKRLWQRKILIDTNTMCHKREEILEIGGWDENLCFWEDWEMTLRISKEYPDGFLSLNRTMIDYEQKIDTVDQEAVFAVWEREEEKIFRKHEGHPLLEDQSWFPPSKNNKSTLGVIEYLKSKHK